MQIDISEAEQAALSTIVEHGAVRIAATSNHFSIYDRLVRLGLAYTTAFDENARFYGLTELGKLTAAAHRTT